MSPDTYGGRLVENSFPRMSGDEPNSNVAQVTRCQFSPRERG